MSLHCNVNCYPTFYMYLYTCLFHHQMVVKQEINIAILLNRNVHSHITRGNNDLHVTVVNKNYGKKVSNIKQPSFGMDYLIH